MTQAANPHKKFYTVNNEIWLDEENILRLRTLEMGEMDLDEAMACFAAYEQLGCKRRKVLQLIDARNSVTITKEARDYIASQADQYFIASAVIGHSLPVRLVVNFFNQFYRNKIPLKMFSTEKEALKWLRKFKK